MIEAIFGSNVNAVLLVVTLVAMFVAACAIAIPWLTRKGVNVPAALEVAEGVLVGADTITDVLKAAFPTSAIACIADKVIDYARIGVQKAEQLYKIEQISGDERKTEAIKFVNDALALAGVERSPAIDKIIDGAIEAAVMSLGHELTVETVVEYNEDGEGYGGDVAL